MKKNITVVLFLGLSILLFASEADNGLKQFAREKVINQIHNVQSPYINGSYIVFTADKSARFVGIAFDYENFRIIHSFSRLPIYEASDDPVDSVLFYINEFPKELDRISYRLVIDGLWTTDPTNSQKIYDPKTNTQLSVINITNKAPDITEKKPSGTVSFVYYGPKGQQIRLAGSFNNWDSYMYYMKEVSPGKYQLDLPLPSGVHYYNFYNGINVLIDKNNPDRGYTRDGKVVSKIMVE